jgi:predicted dinucleotide-utilizing enzyme
MEVRVVNAPAPDNPKTSMLVAHSVARAIMNHFSPIRMV